MIISIDFDGTLFEHEFPEIGKPRLWLIEKAKKWREEGHKLILWTCREDVTRPNRCFKIGDYLTDAVNACKEHGLEFDAVNQNLDEGQCPPGYYSRKIFADVYIDDKSVTFSDDTQTFVFNHTLCGGGFLV